MTSIDNFLSEDIPELLKISNEEIIFKEGIERREKFHKFFKKNIEKVVTSYLPDTLYKIEKTTPSVTFVAGSRAWDQYFKNECKENLVLEELSPLEKNSILPGNYDVFCICTDSTKIDNIYKEICICFDKIISKLNDVKELSSTYSLTYISNAGKEVDEKNKQKISNHKFYAEHLEKYCPIETNFSEEGCVFPACKAMHLELTFDPIKKTKKTKEESFDEKVLLYFEVIYIPDKNTIYTVNKELITPCVSDIKYLNLTGLYLFAELILKRSKEYDVDLYRKHIMEKIIGRYDIDPEKMYLKVIKLYKQLFSSRQDFKLKMGILLKNFIELKDNDFFNSLGSEVTETFRPFINTFVTHFDDTLHYKTHNYIFITGGDAYRRYIPDIKRTNDIDTKVIYSTSKEKEKLVERISLLMTELIAVLYKNKTVILKNLESHNNLSSDNITLKIHFRPIYTSQEDDQAGQFRLRFIEKDGLTLFSIDYRSKINIYLKIGELEVDTVLNHDIPIVDLVLSKSNMDFSFAVEMSNGVPVASSNYLKKDLTDIYKEINQNLKLRFHKSSKDRQRFISLVNYLKRAKELLESSRDRKLKRRIDDYLSDFDIQEDYKKRKEEDEEMTDSLVSEDNFMDIDTIEGSNVVIDIANFKNYPLLAKNTLDVRYFENHYERSLRHDSDIVKKYSDLLLKRIKDNDKLPENEKEEKLQLSFNDIHKIYSEKEYMNNMSIDLFSQLKI
jgi:hypothetical protein